jgi:hypothetical protein
MTLDLVVSERLRNPSRWEWEQYRAARAEGRKADLRDWTDILDHSSIYRWDDSVLRKVEEYARRAEYQRKLWFMPAPAAIGAAVRPNVFRALFQRNVGGTTGASDFWVDASFTTVDGGTGKTGGLVDYVDSSAHAFTQSSTGNQAPIAATDSDLASALGLTFTAAGNTHYRSNRIAPLWNYLHNGAGCSLYLSYRPTGASVNQFICATASSTAATGMWVIERASALVCAVARSVVGSYAVSEALGVLQSPLASGSAIRVELHHGSSASPNFRGHCNGVDQTGGAYENAVSTADASGALTIGASQVGTTACDMVFRAAYGFHRVHTDAERTIVRRFVQSDCGIPA